MTIIEEIRNRPGAYIIAEVGVNYYDIATSRGISPLEAAMLMIDEASAAQANAVKFQTYKASKLASKNSPAYWDRNEEPIGSQFELFSKFDAFGEDEYQRLAAHCIEKGIAFWSTPFDFESVDYLEPLLPAYKISSSDLTNLPFIAYIAKKGKPVFLSTGASTVGEIDRAVHTITSTGNTDICLMHCILDYPTAYQNVHLNMLRHLHSIFPDFLLGFSDHTRPDDTMITNTVAFLLGAKVIEKHFTLDKGLKGNDHYHAMDPADLKMLVYNIGMVETVLGQYQKRPLDCEEASRAQARRSIVAVRDILADTVISREDLTFKRPGTGLSPEDLEKVVGRKARRNISEDDLIRWDDF